MFGNEGRKRVFEVKCVKGKFWNTNAPAHWPSMPLFEGVENGLSLLDVLSFGGILERRFDESKCGCRIVAHNATRLARAGIIDVPYEVDDNGKRTPVFLIDASDMRACEFIAGVLEYYEDIRARSDGPNSPNRPNSSNSPKPVYFSTSSLPNSHPASPFRPLSPADFTPYGGKFDKESLRGMWWSEGDVTFANSSTKELLSRIYEKIQGVESLICAAFLVEFGMLNEVVRMSLPDENRGLPIVGPEGRMLVVDFSKGNGIRFQFPCETIERAPSSYRDDLLAAFERYVSDWKSVALAQGLELDPEGFSNSLKWWRSIEEMDALHEEKGIHVSFIGTNRADVI